MSAKASVLLPTANARHQLRARKRSDPRESRWRAGCMPLLCTALELAWVDKPGTVVYGENLHLMSLDSVNQTIVAENDLPKVLIMQLRHHPT